MIAPRDLQGVSHMCNTGELYHSESLQMNSVLSKGPRDALASSFQWPSKYCKLKLYPPKLEPTVHCLSGESWVQFGKWDVSFPVLPVTCPSASHDFLAKSSLERITPPSALQAVYFYVPAALGPPSPAAGPNFASVTDLKRVWQYWFTPGNGGIALSLTAQGVLMAWNTPLLRQNKCMLIWK